MLWRRLFPFDLFGFPETLYQIHSLREQPLLTIAFVWGQEFFFFKVAYTDPGSVGSYIYSRMILLRHYPPRWVTRNKLKLWYWSLIFLPYLVYSVSLFSPFCVLAPHFLILSLILTDHMLLTCFPHFSWCPPGLPPACDVGGLSGGNVAVPLSLHAAMSAVILTCW